MEFGGRVIKLGGYSHLTSSPADLGSGQEARTYVNAVCARHSHVRGRTAWEAVWGHSVSWGVGEGGRVGGKSERGV